MPAKKYVNNAPDKKDGAGKWLRSYTAEPYTKALTRSGQLWVNMEARCSEKYKISYPSYIGIENGFKDFQEFAEWCQTQDGYMDKDGKRFWQLDKDLLVPGNKTYSKDTCIFVPSDVNTVFNNPQNNGLKLGVSVYQYDNSKFYAECKVGGSKVNLGVFTTENAAHEAWREVKIGYVESLVLKYKDYPLIVRGLRNKAESLGLHL